MYGFGFRCALKVERRINLVYGGGSVGLMGLVSQAVHDGGRHVIGFVSSSLYLSLSPSTYTRNNFSFSSLLFIGQTKNLFNIFDEETKLLH